MGSRESCQIFRQSVLHQHRRPVIFMEPSRTAQFLWMSGLSDIVSSGADQDGMTIDGIIGPGRGDSLEQLKCNLMDKCKVG
jgi:hypothetical protein